MQSSIEIMANWWCDQITTPNSNFDNGVDSHGLLGNFLNRQSRAAAPKDAPEKFKKIFIEKAIAHEAENGYFPEMSVDYHPCDFLLEVAKASGIDENAFPCKTYSQIRRDGKPYGTCGYGNPAQELLPN